MSYLGPDGQGVVECSGAGTAMKLLQGSPEGVNLLNGTGFEVNAVESLFQAGLITTGHNADDLCRQLGAPPASLWSDRWREGIYLRAHDPAAAAVVERHASEAGIRMSLEAGLQCFIASDYLLPDVQQECENARMAGIPVMLAQLNGDRAVVGPVFTSASPCSCCFLTRLRGTRWLESQLLGGGTAGLIPAADGRTEAAARWVVQELARWLLSAPENLEGAVWIFDWRTMRSRRREVFRNLRCQFCGDPDKSAQGLSLNSVRVWWTSPVEPRSVNASETLKLLEPLADDLTGILHPAPFPSNPICEVHAVAYLPAIPPPNRRIAGAILQPRYASGRGRTAEEARAVCYAEAVERYSCQFRGDEPCVSATREELTAPAISPESVLLFSQAQYELRAEWNQRHHRDLWIPERWSPAERIDWIAGWDLHGGERRYLPLAVALEQYMPPSVRWIADADSTGCGAGVTREEAILAGLLELVERDAVALWWYSRAALPIRDLAPMEDSPVSASLDRLAECGWSVRVHDLTTDLAIPVMLAVGVREDGKWMWGAAAHLEATVALGKAVAELGQMTGSRLREPPAPAFSPEMLSGPRLAAPHFVDIRNLLLEAECRTRRAGYQVSAFDLTKSDIGFPVFRVVAPGLRPIKPRFAPGRLYETPIRLGWATSSTAEADLREYGP